jgi:predicted XRE-type DNA-binding protein
MLRKSKAMTDDVSVTRSSGNVFADLGLPNSEEELVKARLVVELRSHIKELGISQTAAAKLMGVAQPDLSKLLKGRVTGFSLDRLLGFVRALGTDVEIKLKPSRTKREGHMRLMVA